MAYFTHFISSSSLYQHLFSEDTLYYLSLRAREKHRKEKLIRGVDNFHEDFYMNYSVPFSYIYFLLVGCSG